MEDIIKKNLIDFCKLVPNHVEKWRSEMPNILKKVDGITNLSEQLRHIKEADVNDIESGKESKDHLEREITTLLNFDYYDVVESISKLGLFNNDLKNKLGKFEESTLQLDWTNMESILIKGTPTVPPLERILQTALEYFMYFNTCLKSIQYYTKYLDWYSEENMKLFEKAFRTVNLEDSCINFLVAITQYVDESALTFV